MNRVEIYKEIDNERDYQDSKWKNQDVSDLEKSISEWIIYIEKHLEKAKSDIYQLDKTDALSEIRKVAALSVACLEIHGCPHRTNFFL